MKREFKIALLSSPLFAIYAVAPIYLFDFVPVTEVVEIFTVFTVITFLGWVSNIFVMRITQDKPKWKRYLLSYMMAFGLHFGSVLIGYFTHSIPDLDVRYKFIVYPIISILAFNTVTLLLINLLVAEKKRKHSELEVQKLTFTNLEAEMKILQQQLQPHFLFNALSILKSLINENSEEAENYTVKLSEFLRYSVEAHNSELVILEEELQFTRSYIELQQVRFPNSFVCTIDIPEEVMERKIPVFGLQILVENALKHNQFTSKKPLIVQISVEGYLLHVTNNKLARVNASSGTGTGLSNLNKRYQLLSGKEISITENETRFGVTLELL